MRKILLILFPISLFLSACARTSVVQELVYEEETVPETTVPEIPSVTVFPVPLEFSTEPALTDGTYPADIKKGSLIKGQDGKISSIVCTLYAADFFAVEDIDKLSPGDTIIISGGPVEISEIKRNHDCVTLNGGYELGGYYLSINDHRYYCVQGEDDISTYSRLCEDIVIPFDPEVQFLDQSRFASEEQIKQHDFSEFMNSHTLNHYNTTVCVKYGKIIEILITYIP